jgi:hypothetical protein
MAVSDPHVIAEFMNSLEKKLDFLRECYVQDGGFGKLAADSAEAMNGGKYAAFISVCDINTRASVLRGAGDSPEEAWESACRAAREYVRKSGLMPAWVKSDVTVKSERVSFAELEELIAKSRNEFFRRGISFDEGMHTALIEGEINGSRVITYKEHKIELVRVNKRLSECGLKTLTAFPEEVRLFDCRSFFTDGGGVYPLYESGNNCGRRIISKFDDKTALKVIETAAQYLENMVGLDGKFEYGYYPIFHKEIPGYNILRHSSSIWSLICSYRLTKDKFTLNQIQKAIGYMVANTFKKYPDRPGVTNTVYLAEKSKGEVKVGGNAIAVIMLTEYMDATGSQRYRTLCEELGNGIMELFDKRDGSFFHVLNFPTLSPKDKFRTVYYDGESTFALARLYGLTGDKKWLDAAALSADRFIREGYEKYRDHWVAYAMNELTKHLPEDKYLSFGLKNANVNLDRIYNQDTTYHTYLELLCVTFEMYSRILEQGLECSYLEKFRAEKFVETIYHRADYMLNGYGYPEFVMYLKFPACDMGGFFVRHDGFRMRIDDIQHFCGAYYSFYRNYGRLEELRNSFNKAEHEG